MLTSLLYLNSRLYFRVKCQAWAQRFIEFVFFAGFAQVLEVKGDATELLIAEFRAFCFYHYVEGVSLFV